MGPVGPGFQFRMSLGPEKERVIFELYHLDNSAVRGDTGEGHPVFGQFAPVIVIHLIAVAVAFIYGFFPVKLKGF